MRNVPAIRGAVIACVAIAFALSGWAMADEAPGAAKMSAGAAFPGSTVNVASDSVFRLRCEDKGTFGTAFLHKSGKLITAAHVIKDCEKLTLQLRSGNFRSARTITADYDLDLAIVEPSVPIVAEALPLYGGRGIFPGMQVATWGFPAGYSGMRPMLSVGYLSGGQLEPTETGKLVGRYVVNAAFNSGNSGGPLILVETGKVVGVVVSKATPVSGDTIAILKLLENQKYGMTYELTQPDGSKRSVSEGYLIGQVLDELRRQVQLVIGLAVPGPDLTGFLEANNIEP